MVLAEDDADRLVRRGEQARQLEDALARHDDLVLVGLLDAGFQRAQRQAVAIGGDRAEAAGVDLQQHAVEVVAHVLLGHGEAGALDQPAQLALRHGEGQRTLAFLHRGEVVGRQGGQAEAAAPGLDQQLLLVDADVDQRI
ncbi:hypothetical protein D3C78_1228660 [compost metagenome]